MKNQYITKFLWIFFIVSCFSSLSADSITSRRKNYTNLCQKASEDPDVFNKFRSMESYFHVVEIDDGTPFAQYLRSGWKRLGKYLEDFRKVDQIGNPMLEDYEDLGQFSATNLRYIFHADQMTKRFTLPQGAKVVEIGAGFGGQAYILHCLHPCACYYIYDLPEVECLINKVMETLNVNIVRCLPLDVEMPEEKIDLVISNYAYSECDRDTQLSYFDRVIKKADRGYIVYNQIAFPVYGIPSLTVDEFVALLKENGCRPKVNVELFTGGNFLIVWDKTK